VINAFGDHPIPQLIPNDPGIEAFVNLAIIRRYLRILAPDDPSDRT
jgi:hypothetical protein